MKTNNYFTFAILAFLLSILVIVGCTKEVDLEFPEGDPKIVVDGLIEPGSPPFIFLSKSNSFNQGVDPSTLSNIFLHEAIVTINDGENDYILDELCVSNLDPTQLETLSNSIGISVEDLENIEYCIYTNFALIGEIGKDYDLVIEYENETLHSTTSLLEPVPLDSIWFQTNGNDSLGLIHGLLSDPANQRNAYRWFAQRINLRPGTNVMKDPTFIAPLGSAFDDRFIDGLSFEFFAARGIKPNSQAPEDNNIEAGLFKTGDTVVVKFSAIPHESFMFYFIMEDQLVNNGSPFATPTNIPSNIDGGLGVWTGYSSYFDTLVIQ